MKGWAADHRRPRWKGNAVDRKCVMVSVGLVGLGLSGIALTAIAAEQASTISAVIASCSSLAVVAALMLVHLRSAVREMSSQEMSALREDVVVDISQKYDRMIERLNTGLELEVSERLRSSLATRHALIMGLAKLADYRDGETGAHLERLREYSDILARDLRDAFDEIDDEWIQSLCLAAVLHDIGKVGVPDSILLKPARLSIEEREIIKRHTRIGADTLIDIRRNYGDDAMINMGIQVTLQHHERWDGKGYPFGISGDNIALSARIVSLADFYDALTTERVYKKAYSHKETCKMIREARGTQFDPAIVDAFERLSQRFNEIRHQLSSDTEIDPLRDVA